LFLGVLGNLFILGYFKYYNFFIDNYNLLFDKLVSDKRFTIEKISKKISTSLINKIWMMLFVIFLLSLEWFIRKYFGKV